MSWLNCPSCGRPAETAAGRCGFCGAALNEAPDAFERCSNGHIVSEGAQFCPWCGEEMRPAGGGRVTGPKTENSRSTEPMTGPAFPPPGRFREPATSPGPQGGGQRKTMVMPRPEEKRTVIFRPDGGAAPAPGGGQARLVGFLVSYSLSPLGAFFPLREGRQTIGSGPAMRIRIEDDQLSGEHALILYRQGRFIFEDRLSSNGSRINGQEAAGQVELKHGDRLGLGAHTYIFVGISEDEPVILQKQRSQ
ncbi:MAG: FHA domain-containing protein [Candidatus Adiutrix sp.]|jgi:hypothetical protein|nr:FHA domain-containing protein [Candidatus Adiutrix sp.]